MQRITALAARRELRVFACMRSPTPGVCPVRPLTGKPATPSRWPCRLRGRRVEFFAGHGHRLFSTEPGSSGARPGISVVGVPDPLTWIRCKVLMWISQLWFDLDVTSEEFDRGVKQALVHVSKMMSTGDYSGLKGIVSPEMVDYVEERCSRLTDAHRQQLAISMDDIIFVFPEDVSAVLDTHGGEFCFVTLRFWLLTDADGPDDPEASKIFKIAPSEDGGAQKRIVTAVLEFKRDLSRGAEPEWTVITVWHWNWKLAE
ncbi:m-AAA protease-interacting protein 1, mitochondrial [Genypterus blacodes]|uniref:m-AAA protease-interacting protein 1, mitochondrial n=1 Tax=Genypterus blacodes TaxID=154954 RepID=UPI003F77200D